MTAKFWWHHLGWHRVRVGYVPAAAAAGEKDKADAHAMHARLLPGPGQVGGGRRAAAAPVAGLFYVRPACCWRGRSQKKSSFAPGSDRGAGVGVGDS